MNEKLKKVFILGVGGKLGRALFDVFKNDYDCSGFSRTECNITDSKKLEEIIAAQKPDIVINASAYNAVDKCEDPQYIKEAMAVNATAPGIIAAACRKNGAKIIHYSSDYIFDGNSPEGYAEDAPIKPVNAYGQTKWLGEDAIRKSGVNFYVIRTSRLFGPGGTSVHGKEGVIEQLVRIANSSVKMDVVDGEIACPTYSIDLAHATQELLKKTFPFGIYHITNSGPCSRLEFYGTLVKALKLPLEIVPVNAHSVIRPAPRPLFSILNMTKFPPLRDWRKGLNELVKMYYRR